MLTVNVYLNLTNLVVNSMPKLVNFTVKPSGITSSISPSFTNDSMKTQTIKE